MGNALAPLATDLLPRNTEFWRTSDIITFVVKVASRCNLKCSYCYMYEHPDQSWRSQPSLLSTENVELLAKRLADYVNRKKPRRIIVVAHGGEPLLLGANRLRAFFFTISSGFPHSVTELGLGVQTNATIVTDEIVEVLQEFGVRAGVSIDGPPEWHDLHRVDKAGRGSFSSVLEGIDKLRKPKTGPSVFGGVLVVINPRIEPEDLLVFLQEIDVGAADIILPDYNHETFPHDLPPGTFGRWLIRLFDAWMNEPKSIEIRFFSVLLKLVLGGKYGYDAYGERSGGVLTIETDGTYHALDVLKTTFEGATYTGKSLRSHPIHELESEPLVVAVSEKKAVASKKCLECSIFRTCGGGYLPHRYSADRGFDAESVYCVDMQLIINHVRERVSSELAPYYRGSGATA